MALYYSDQLISLKTIYYGKKKKTLKQKSSGRMSELLHNYLKKITLFWHSCNLSMSGTTD